MRLEVTTVDGRPEMPTSMSEVGGGRTEARPEIGAVMRSCLRSNLETARRVADLNPWTEQAK